MDLGLGLLIFSGLVSWAVQAEGPNVASGGRDSAVCRGGVAWSGRRGEATYAGEDQCEQVVAGG